MEKFKLRVSSFLASFLIFAKFETLNLRNRVSYIKNVYTAQGLFLTYLLAGSLTASVTDSDDDDAAEVDTALLEL